MEQEAGKVLTELSKTIPYAVLAVIAVLGLFFIWVKWGKQAVKCLNCEEKKGKEFWMSAANSQNANIEFLVERAKETERNLEEQKLINKEIITSITEINTNMKLNNQALMLLLNKK